MRPVWTGLQHCYFPALHGKVQIRVQFPIRLDEQSEPEPDVALLRPRSDAYAEAHPGPEDVLLVVEVAETTLDYEQVVKVPLYAAAGLTEVWVVNLPEACVEVYQEPQEGGYRRQARYARTESWESKAFPGMSLKVEEVLPPA